MKGLGVDVTLIERFENKEELAKRVLSPLELDIYYQKKKSATFLASRFACKECYVKATGDKTIDYRSLSILDDENGKPFLYKDGNKVSCLISISHDIFVFAVIIIDDESI